MALQSLHQDASIEMNNSQTALNESNSKVAIKLHEIAKLITDLEARPQQATPPTATPKEATANSQRPRFIDPVTGLWSEAEHSKAQPEQFFMGSPSKEQKVPEPAPAPMRAPPGYGGEYGPQDWSQPQQQPFRAHQGVINVTAYSKLFEETIAPMK